MSTRAQKVLEALEGKPELLFAVNDGASRLSEGYFGRIVYQCDTCDARWSITPADILKQLDDKTARRGSRPPKAKSFAELWRDTPAR